MPIRKKVISDESFEPELSSLNTTPEKETGVAILSIATEPNSVDQSHEGWVLPSNDCMSQTQFTLTPELSIGNIKGKRRQKSLQFITTEMIFMIMNQEQIYGPATVNPSDISIQLHITRRRIYDIIHVLSCLGLLQRLNYRSYGWLGIPSMQSLFSQLFKTPFEEFECSFDHCFKKRINHTNISQEKEGKNEESTTKHITIKFLKYLFLYVKSGRKTFNKNDITSLVIKEFFQNDEHNTGECMTKKQRKDREKSIERRLYDISSVMCGLGVIKRKVDSIDWPMSIHDKQAESIQVCATYSKGNNMMICLHSYILQAEEDFFQGQLLNEQDTIIKCPDKDLISVLDMWEYMLYVFIDRHIVTSIDPDYLVRMLNVTNIESNQHDQQQTQQSILYDVPSVPSASTEWGREEERQVFASSLPSLPSLLNVSIPTTRRGRVSSVQGNLIQTRQKRGKTEKRGKTDNDEDEDWRLPGSKRPTTKKNESSANHQTNNETDSISIRTNEIGLFAGDDLFWGVNEIHDSSFAYLGIPAGTPQRVGHEVVPQSPLQSRGFINHYFSPSTPRKSVIFLDSPYVNDTRGEGTPHVVMGSPLRFSQMMSTISPFSLFINRSPNISFPTHTVEQIRGQMPVLGDAEPIALPVLPVMPSMSVIEKTKGNDSHSI